MEEKSIRERNLQIAREYVEGGITMKQLGEKYGVCQQRISQIIAESQVLDKLEISANARSRLATIKLQHASTEATEKLIRLAMEERGKKGVYADIQLLQQVLDRAGVRVVKKDDGAMHVEIDFGEQSGMRLGVPDHSRDNGDA